MVKNIKQVLNKNKGASDKIINIIKNIVGNNEKIK